MSIDQQPQSILNEFMDLLEKGTLAQVRARLADMHPADTALVLESLPGEDRLTVWELTDPAKQGDILAEISEDIRPKLILKMDKQELLAATETLETDDLADIFTDLPVMVSKEVLESLDEENRRSLESALSYPEDSAGGLMNFDVITVRPGMLVGVVLRYLRVRGKMPDTTDTIFVTGRDGKYLGSLLLADLVSSPTQTNIDEIMLEDAKAVNATVGSREVAGLFERHNLVTAAVVNDNNMLLGRITIDDVVDVIRLEADHTIMGQVGLREEHDIFAPVFVSSQRRAIWLGVNLITALMASWVIALFDQTIEQLVALAILMPVVASMGGIAGSQTLTLVIRGIALEQIGESNARQIMKREITVGALNGLVWAVIIAIIATTWFESVNLGLIIGLAIVINLICAALAGAFIPLALRKLDIDPALAGGVILTTITDIIGFFAFLGLAAVFLIP